MRGPERREPLHADAEARAVIEAALKSVLRARETSRPVEQNPWRFSGRWWASALVLRRARP